MLHTLSARLTWHYTLLFALLALLVFGFAYRSLETNMVQNIDSELHEDGIEFLSIYQQQGLGVLQRALDREALAENPEQIFFRLFASNNQLLSSSDLRTWPDLPSLAEEPSAEQEERFTSLRLPNHSDRVRIFSRRLDPQLWLQMGYQMHKENHLLTSFLQVSGLAFVAMLLSGGLFGNWIARRALRGIEQVRQSAERISRGDLSVRIPPNGGSVEIHNLAQSFNRMQERIQTLVGELGDVTNNVAHDLRSPLTRIRGLAETTLTGEQQLEDYQEMAVAVIEESDRLVGIINTMLEIAETDAGLLPLQLELIDMRKVVADVAELYSSVAEDKQICLNLQIETTQLLVRGDLGRLQRALANLLDNAIKFTPAGGRVNLSAQLDNGQVQILLADTGPGIPPADLPQIFKRFFRGEQSRTTPGSGLGLSLVQAIIQAHDGTIELLSPVGQGTKATLYLPLAEK